METMKIVRLGVIIFFLKVLLCGFAEGSSCTPGFEPKLLVLKVQQDQFHQGRRLGRVIFNACDGRTRTYFQSSDKRFDVDTDGTVTLKSQVALHESHKVFSVHAWDSDCAEHTVSVRVEHVHHQEDHHMDRSSPQLKAHATGVCENNDNRPVFTQNPFNGNVPEAAEKGHEFMTVTATDADDPDTDNGVIRYSIVKQDPELPNPNMFKINSVTGGIRVNSLGLDREKWSKYTLTVVAADLKGKGHRTTGTAVITVTDSNDNAPQFDQTSHTVSVPENKVGAEVAKLTVTDGDEERSPAWSTKYRIISGDKGGFFNVSTGPSQLEGVITTVKPLDFEKNKQYILSVIVENDEPFVGSLATSTATVTVNVEDVNEPPEFNPKEKIISKPEDSPVDSDLVSYTVTDPDIGKSQKITYKIGNDPAGWLSVNQNTGLIKVRKPMDRESSYVKDGKYKAIILAVDDDKTPATGTGTLIIELSDVNDNAPVINERTIEMCNRGSAPVLLSITDKDGSPYAGPFTVETQGETSKNWSTVMNDTSTGVFLKLKSSLEQGDYDVVLRVFDRERLFQDSTIQATVFDCEKASFLGSHSFCLR